MDGRSIGKYICTGNATNTSVILLSEVRTSSQGKSEMIHHGRGLSSLWGRSGAMEACCIGLLVPYRKNPCAYPFQYRMRTSTKLFIP